MSSNLDSITEWTYRGALDYESFGWTCPFCGRGTTITGSDRNVEVAQLTANNAEGRKLALIVFVVCPNLECKRFTLSLLLFDADEGQRIGLKRLPASGQTHQEPDLLKPATWQLVPASEAKIYPEYVPKPIREDYEEACLIRDLSPKASATLSRRCLQGMIRDYWKIVDRTLNKEIEALEGKVASKTWQAIDAVRGVGNIGAHMEKDINVIVDVDQKEAAMLIGLIEMLIEDWYINEHERDQKLSGIINLGALKKQARKLLPPSDSQQ